MNRYQQAKQIKETYRNALPDPKQKWPPNIKQSLTFIHTHLFDAELSIAWIKEQCRIQSKSYAGHFCRYVNRYPKEYILFHRMEAAKQILKDTEVPVTMVAISTGFNSMSSFSNSFKAREDVTPSQWREQKLRTF